MISPGLRFLKKLISLEEGKADDQVTIDAIKSNVEFRGSNLWVLIFAIFIASIGLNVNSGAVVIGAMLISPLMGPIMGIGLGIGINDPDLIKKGLFNLSIAAFISVITSALYFLVTPIDDAQSELLARTTPTLWDVLIATFGGFAGIVATTRKEKTNAIPGVAIATALMPPLCTAGYGLGTGNFTYFFGAFYLFFINCVFICLSTFVIVRYLRYPHKEFAEHKQAIRVKRSIFICVLITVLPSIYTGYRVVQKSIFEKNANKFIQAELKFDDAQVVSKTLQFDDKESLIDVLLVGTQIDDSVISRIAKKLPQYTLPKTKLLVHQGYNKNQEAIYAKLNQNLKASLLEEMYRQNQEVLGSKVCLPWQNLYPPQELLKLKMFESADIVL